MFNPDPKIKPTTIEPIKKAASSVRQFGVKGFRTKNKYNNVRTEYNGIKYDSKLEAQTAQELDWRLKAKDIKEWRRQVKIPLKVNEVFIANYYIDFIYTDKYDQVHYLEVKGLELPLWQMKWRLLTALINEIEPGAELEIIKQK